MFQLHSLGLEVKPKGRNVREVSGRPESSSCSAPVEFNLGTLVMVQGLMGMALGTAIWTWTLQPAAPQLWPSLPLVGLWHPPSNGRKMDLNLERGCPNKPGGLEFLQFPKEQELVEPSLAP